MKIILFEPQIPQNAGNIVRTCVVTGTELVMVKPLGFSTADRWLKRAGLDYWHEAKITYWDNLEEGLESLNEPFYFLSSKGNKIYSNVSFEENAALIFGSETSGLPAHFHQKWPEKFLRIPMIDGARCLNLATSAGIVLYEALRNNKFKDMI